MLCEALGEHAGVTLIDCGDAFVFGYRVDVRLDDPVGSENGTLASMGARHSIPSAARNPSIAASRSVERELPVVAAMLAAVRSPARVSRTASGPSGGVAG